MKRKIDTYFLEWKRNPNRMPLIVRGARQVGKTFSIRQFGKTYESFVEINFVTNPEYKSIFSKSFATNDIIQQMSLLHPELKFIENNTLIFFDEIQEFPDCTTCILCYIVLVIKKQLALHIENIAVRS